MKLSEAEYKTVDKEVNEMLYAYCNDLRAEGLAAQFRYMDNSGQFFWVPVGATKPHGLDSTLAMARRAMANVQNINRSYDTLVVQPVTVALALYSARVRTIVSYNNGHDTTILTLETGTVVQRKAGWRFLCGQTSVATVSE